MRHHERGTRNSQPRQDPSDPDQVLEALLAGYPLPDEDPAGLQPVADVLTALRQPAAPAELTGQASALAEFRARSPRTARTTWPRRRGGPVRGPLLRPRPATPEPSTSPAAQPSAQSSTAPGPHDPHSSPSPPP